MQTSQCTTRTQTFTRVGFGVCANLPPHCERCRAEPYTYEHSCERVSRTQKKPVFLVIITLVLRLLLFLCELVAKPCKLTNCALCARKRVHGSQRAADQDRTRVARVCLAPVNRRERASQLSRGIRGVFCLFCFVRFVLPSRIKCVFVCFRVSSARMGNSPNPHTLSVVVVSDRQ